MRRRYRVVSVLCGSVVLLAGASVAPAAGSPKPPPSAGAPAGAGPSAADLRRQFQLDALADQIIGVHHSENSHEGGYAGAVVHPESGILSLYWKGIVPASVRKAQADAAAQGLAITVTPARYSAHELELARQSLEAAVDGKDAAVEPAAAWNTIVTAPDGSGLRVTYTSTATAAAQASAARMASPVKATAASPATVTARLSTLSGVPVRASASEPLVGAFGRIDDNSPFWAGAQTLHWIDATHAMFCSSGFGGTRGGHEVLLSAAHCGGAGRGVNGQVWQTGTGTTIGSTAGSTATTDSYDTAFIQIVSGSSAGSNFYDGAWNDPNGYNKHIASWGVNHDGDWVCTSGAMSGVHCGLQIQYAGFDANVDGIVRHNEVQTRQISGVAAAEGDSGGPVVFCTGGTCDPTNMQARGIISALDVQTTCGSTAYPTKCYSIVYYEGLTSVVNILGWTPHT